MISACAEESGMLFFARFPLPYTEIWAIVKKYM